MIRRFKKIVFAAFLLSLLTAHEACTKLWFDLGVGLLGSSFLYKTYTSKLMVQKPQNMMMGLIAKNSKFSYALGTGLCVYGLWNLGRNFYVSRKKDTLNNLRSHAILEGEEHLSATLEGFSLNYVAYKGELEDMHNLLLGSGKMPVGNTLKHLALGLATLVGAETTDFSQQERDFTKEKEYLSSTVEKKSPREKAAEKITFRRYDTADEKTMIDFVRNVATQLISGASREDAVNEIFNDLAKGSQKNTDGLIADVLVVDTTIKGFITYKFYTDDTTGSVDATHGFIELIAVDQHGRGKGYGKLLIEHAIGYFEDRNCSIISLDFMANNTAAVKLYEKMGFILEAPYKEGKSRDAISRVYLCKNNQH